MLREEHKLGEITLALGTPHPDARFADTPLPHSRIGGAENEAPVPTHAGASSFQSLLPVVLRPPQLMKRVEVLLRQLDRPATRERPPDVARQASPKAVAAIIDLNQRTFAFKAEGLGAFFRHCSIPAFATSPPQ